MKLASAKRRDLKLQGRRESMRKLMDKAGNSADTDKQMLINNGQ